MRFNFEDNSHLEIRLLPDTKQIQIVMSAFEVSETSNLFRTTSCVIDSTQYKQITSEIDSMLHIK